MCILVVVLSFFGGMRGVRQVPLLGIAFWSSATTYCDLWAQVDKMCEQMYAQHSRVRSAQRIWIREAVSEVCVRVW